MVTWRPQWRYSRRRGSRCLTMAPPSDAIPHGEAATKKDAAKVGQEYLVKVSDVLREIQNKGDDARFKKVEHGRFALAK